MKEHVGRIAVAVLVACGLSGCDAEEPVVQDRIVNGYYSQLPGVGVLLSYTDSGGWRPFCTASVYRGNTLVTVEHCGRGAMNAEAVAFSTDFDIVRDEDGYYDMPDPDIHENGLEDARSVTNVRIVAHPDDPSFVGDGLFTEGVAALRVDEPYATNWWLNIGVSAIEGLTYLVGYGTDPFDEPVPGQPRSRGRQRLGIMNMVGDFFAPPDDPPPLVILLPELDPAQGACGGDSGGPGIQGGAITSVASRVANNCEAEVGTLSVEIGLYLDPIDEAVDDWNACLLPTDFNGDGIVDGDDLAIWSANYGCSSCAPRNGDANGDSRVTGSDFLALQRTFGDSCP